MLTRSLARVLSAAIIQEPRDGCCEPVCVIEPGSVPGVWLNHKLGVREERCRPAFAVRRQPPQSVTVDDGFEASRLALRRDAWCADSTGGTRERGTGVGAAACTR